jgi:hypothetical protein
MISLLRIFIWLELLAVGLALGACGKPSAAIAKAEAPKPPGWVCASPVTKKTLETMMFTAGQRQIDRDVAENSTTDWTGVRVSMESIKQDGILSIESIVFRGMNQETGAVSCGATVSIVLPDAYRTNKFIKLAKSVRDTRVPPELFENSAQIPISYTVQHAVDGKGDVVSSSDFPPIYDTLLVLAFAKWQSSLIDALEAQDTHDQRQRISN